MRIQRFVVCAIVVMAIAGLTLNVGAQQISMRVDASKTGAPIAKDLYGFFSEFLNSMYEGGLWAEMLGDRKFFYPVDSSPTQTPPNNRKFVNRWRPVGSDDNIVMDLNDAYVGAHSPLIKLDAITPHGIQQAGLGLKSGKKYSGRVILAGDPGTQINVSLIWGNGPGDRQTIPIRSVGKNYAKYPLSFIAQADTENASLEIAGTGKGSFHIGAVSLMPADNIEGYRADMIALYKEIGPTLVRWPGGNFTSGYDWRDGLGDPDKRPPRYDFAWHALESNDMGVDDYMKLVRILDIDPYLCVNTGFGDAFSAAQELEYVNGAADTPMGKLRAANGHPAPYQVKWWNVGNEMYGSWQLGHMSLADYAIKQNMFVEAMRRVDPTIVVVASGADPAEMTSTGAGKSITGKNITEFGDPLADWNNGLLANSAKYMDAIAEHLYPQAERAFDAQQGKFVPVTDSLVDKARRLPNRVKCVTDAWDEYQKRFPNLKMSKYPIALDEWTAGRITSQGHAFSSGDTFQALSAAEAMNEMFRHSDLFVASAYTAFSRLLAINKTDATIAPLGLMFEVYRKHFGTIPVAVLGDCPQHDVQGTVNVDKPKVPSGSDTYPLDVVAALTSDRKALTIAVVNPTESAQQVEMNFTGVVVQGPGKQWLIAPRDLLVLNEPGKPMTVNIAESPLNDVPQKLDVPPISISIYEFAVNK